MGGRSGKRTEKRSAPAGKKRRSVRRRPALKKPWSWILPSAVSLAAPFLLLLLLELVLRIAGYGYPANLALPVPGRENYGVNLRFGWRFFPRSIARVCPLFVFDEQKKPGTFRTVILGASAAQGYPDHTFGFSRALEAMARLRFPETDFEFINTSIVATNSHVVLPISREFARYEPDLFIVYLGNNEVIGPYGIASEGRRAAGRLGLIRLGIRLGATRVGQLARAFASRFREEDEILDRWGGMEMYSENTIAASDPRLRRVYGFFESNLEGICDAAEEAGAPLLLCTVPVNLWDSAPFASVHREGLSGGERERWERLYAGANDAAGEKRWEDALALYREALAVDDEHAELNYRYAQALLAAGERGAAGEAFLRARDLDALRFRADGEINERIRAVAGRRRGVSLVDLEAYFEEFTGGPDPEAAAALFYEHVHPTFRGNHRIAEAIFPSFLREMGARGAGDAAERAPTPPTYEECADWLLYTDWNEHRDLGIILELLDDYPFPQQFDHEEKWARAVRRMEELKAAATQEKMGGIYRAYLEALERRPEDLALRMNAIELLKETGQRDAAVRMMNEVMATQPPTDWKN